jgi:hypothetical protein
MTKVIGKIRGGAVIHFNSGERNQMLNLRHLGSPYCNRIDSAGPGPIRFVAIKHKNMEKLEKAQKKANPNVFVKVEAEVLSDGSFGEIKIVK